MSSKQSGRFIVIEGIDGSGKTTQMEKLCERLAAQGLPVVRTFEPTDGPVGTLIRQMLSGSLPVDQHTLALLFAADRTDHLVRPETGVCQMVDAGKVVVCDRYYFSSYAYHAQYLDMDWVIEANRPSADRLRPHATLFLDVDPERCVERIRARGNALEIFEKLDIMKAVRANYFKAFDKLKDQEQVIIIDGNAGPDLVAERIWEKAAPLVAGEE